MKLVVVSLVLFLSACGPNNPPATNAGATSAASGSSSCSASNSAGQDCKISCQTGEAATCRNGSGSNPPSCTCTSAK